MEPQNIQSQPEPQDSKSPQVNGRSKASLVVMIVSVIVIICGVAFIVVRTMNNRKAASTVINTAP